MIEPGDGNAVRTTMIGKIFDRARLARLADALVIGVTISLPWSTSATSILIVLWLLALAPTLDAAALRRAIDTPAGALPLALWMLALIGVLWSVAPLGERLSGLQVYSRLLALPLFLAQFRHSGRATGVIGGFLVSCTALMALSWVSKTWPSTWSSAAVPGIPVKDYVVQSGEFLLCAFGLMHWAIDAWHQNRRWLASLRAALAMAFIANIVFVATGRASLVVFVALLILLGIQRFGWKGALGVMVGGSILAGAAWSSSPYLRGRVLAVFEEIDRYETTHELTSSGYRLAWWKKSVEFIASAPLVGHGTGSTREMFREVAAKDATFKDAVTDNPHNQTVSIAIQLGLVGVGLLYAMWIAHLLLFRGGGLPAWVGAGVVVQNFVGSLFNSQIFYFTPGWLYVIGVGVLGGTVLAAGAKAAAREMLSRQGPGWHRAPKTPNEEPANLPG